MADANVASARADKAKAEAARAEATAREEAALARCTDLAERLSAEQDACATAEAALAAERARVDALRTEHADALAAAQAEGRAVLEEAGRRHAGELEELHRGAEEVLTEAMQRAAAEAADLRATITRLEGLVLLAIIYRFVVDFSRAYGCMIPPPFRAQASSPPRSMLPLLTTTASSHSSARLPSDWQSSKNQLRKRSVYHEFVGHSAYVFRRVIS